MHEIARTVMSMLKDAVIRGIYYDSIGVKDFSTWSNMISADFGPEAKRHIRDIRKWSILLLKPSPGGKNKKINCWEFMGCGLHVQRSAVLSPDTGICPAAVDKRFDGLYGGANAGRACWVILNTMCHNAIQGTYEEKCKACASCDFYLSVLEEEGNTVLCFPA